MAIPNSPVWFITGCSTGFGRDLARLVLDRGWQTPSAIAGYADTAASRMEGTKAYSGTQLGDPVRAAEAIIAAVERETPPRHLVLGQFGYEAVTAKLAERLRAIEADRDLSLGADFPEER